MVFNVLPHIIDTSHHNLELLSRAADNTPEPVGRREHMKMFWRICYLLTFWKEHNVPMFYG